MSARLIATIVKLLKATLLATLLALLGPGRLAFAQSAENTATLSGVVLDETGAAISDAEVIAANVAAGLQRSTRTAADGAFVMPLLPAGRYVVTAQRDGFAAAEANDVVLTDDEVTRIRIQLKVASVGETVMVAAQKRGDERLQDVPVPVSVVQAGKLAESDQVLLRDYYASVPGFTVTPNYVGRQNLSIRGVAAVSLENPTVGVLIDDVPFGSSTNHGSSVPDIDPSDLARIEVLRGPQGTLYGTNSMGGLLKLVTKEPTLDKLQGQVQLSTNAVSHGAQPGYGFRGSVNIPVASKVAIRASGFTRQDAGYIDNPVLGLEGVNQTDVVGGRFALLWLPSAKTSVKFSALFQRDQWDGLDEAVDDPSLSELQQNYIPRAGRGDRTVQSYGATLKTRLGSFDLTSTTSYGSNRVNLSLDIGAVGLSAQDEFGVSGLIYEAPGDDTTRFTQEVRIGSPLGRKVEWRAGGFLTHENSTFAAIMDAEDPVTGRIAGRWYDSSSGYRFDSYAAFGDLTYHLTPRFDIQFGGRESHDRVVNPAGITTGGYATLFLGGDPAITPQYESTGNVFTYLVTPRIKIAPDLMVYSRFASGYRPGGPNSVISPTTPNQFEADQTQNYELGFKGSFFHQALALDASLYHIRWTNIQFQARDEISLTPYIDNGAAAKSQGVELSVSSRPRSGTSIDVSMSYNLAELTEDFPVTSTAYGAAGDRMPLSSRWSSNISAEQEFPLWTGTTGFVGGAVAYVGERIGPFTDTADRQLFPGYAKADVRVGLRRASWSANLFVNNLADRRGLLDGGLGYFYPAARIYIRPRTVGVSLSRTF